MSKIIATGSYLPIKKVTNFDLAETVDTNDEWIRTRTGILERHIANESETTSFMAAEAAKSALKNSNLSASDIDLIIVATTTPEKTFPSVAVLVQSKIGAKNASAFDVQAVCSGFIYALNIANNAIISGQSKNVLIIGAEKMSSILDWQDRKTCVLFGDGAGAIILQKTADNQNNILACKTWSDGDFENILNTDGGVSTTGNSGFVQMNGQEVFKHAISKMSSAISEVLKIANLTKEQVDWLVPHQANIRIIEMLAKKCRLPLKKVISSVDVHANTSAASIPLALDKANKEGKFKDNEILTFCAIGGGLTWGAAVVRW